MRDMGTESGNQKPVRDKRRLIKRIALFLCFAIVLGILSFSAIQIYMIQSTNEYLISEIVNAPVCDAVIVLGAYVYSSGTPSPVLRDRLDYGYKMYTQGKARKILVSGDHGRDSYDEVNAMKEYLIKMGVPGEDIFMDHAGFNTYDSMYRAKNIFQVNNLVIVTNNFHIQRSVYIARKFDMEAWGYPTPDREIYNMPALNSREKLAKIKAFLDVDILHRKPAFEGDAIPVLSVSGEVTDG